MIKILKNPLEIPTPYDYRNNCTLDDVVLHSSSNFWLFSARWI